MRRNSRRILRRSFRCRGARVPARGKRKGGKARPCLAGISSGISPQRPPGAPPTPLRSILHPCSLLEHLRRRRGSPPRTRAACGFFCTTGGARQPSRWEPAYRDSMASVHPPNSGRKALRPTSDAAERASLFERLAGWSRPQGVAGLAAMAHGIFETSVERIKTNGNLVGRPVSLFRHV